jgi:hypothetical protein
LILPYALLLPVLLVRDQLQLGFLRRQVVKAEAPVEEVGPGPDSSSGDEP